MYLISMFFWGGGYINANYGVPEVAFTFTLCTNTIVIGLLPESLKMQD